MSNALDTIEVDTDAGEYVVNVYGDIDAENPLTSWDHPGMAFYVDGRDSITTDTLSDADRVGDVLGRIMSTVDELYPRLHDVDEETRRRYDKWRAITGSPWQLFTGSDNGNVQGHQWNWYVLIDTSEYVNNVIDPGNAVRGTMQTYRAWAAGEVYGYVALSPDGSDVDSCWGFYGDDRDGYMMEQARDSIAADVAERIEKTNLVGAGIVGLI